MRWNNNLSVAVVSGAALDKAVVLRQTAKIVNNNQMRGFILEVIGFGEKSGS